MCLTTIWTNLYKLTATKVFLGDLLWSIFNAIKKLLILVDKKFFVSDYKSKEMLQHRPGLRC